MALHNFIRDNAIYDERFETYVEDSSGVGSQVPSADGGGSADDMNMCAFHDAIANALVGVFCSIYITQMDVIFDYYCTLQFNGAILLSETLKIFPPLSSDHCHEKNSALFCRYSALIASQIARRDDILHFHAIRAIAATTRYSAAIAAIAP